MNFQMTSALMATQVFHKGAGEYGLLGTTLAVGSLTGALLGARRVGRPRPRLVILAGLAFGGVEIVLGLMPTYLTFACLPPLLGLTLLTMLNAANTTVQLSTAPTMRGRVMALYMMLVMGGTPVGAPIVGWVGATFGARWTLIGGGLMSVFGILLAVVLFHGLRGRPVLGRARISAEEATDSAMAACPRVSVEVGHRGVELVELAIELVARGAGPVGALHVAVGEREVGHPDREEEQAGGGDGSGAEVEAVPAGQVVGHARAQRPGQ
jgi:MFS family permease